MLNAKLAVVATTLYSDKWERKGLTCHRSEWTSCITNVYFLINRSARKEEEDSAIDSLDLQALKCVDTLHILNIPLTSPRPISSRTTLKHPWIPPRGQ